VPKNPFPDRVTLDTIKGTHLDEKEIRILQHVLSNYQIKGTL
jgi:hypothetical protein